MDSGPLPLCRTAKMLLSARALNAIHDGNPGILSVSSQAETEESDLARECEEQASHGVGALFGTVV